MSAFSCKNSVPPTVAPSRSGEAEAKLRLYLTDEEHAIVLKRVSAGGSVTSMCRTIVDPASTALCRFLKELPETQGCRKQHSYWVPLAHKAACAEQAAALGEDLSTYVLKRLLAFPETDAKTPKQPYQRVLDNYGHVIARQEYLAALLQGLATWATASCDAKTAGQILVELEAIRTAAESFVPGNNTTP